MPATNSEALIKGSRSGSLLLSIGVGTVIIYILQSLISDTLVVAKKLFSLIA